MAPEQTDNRSPDLSRSDAYFFYPVLLTWIDHERQAVLVVPSEEFYFFYTKRRRVRAWERADKHTTKFGVLPRERGKDVPDLRYQVQLKFDCIGGTVRTPSDIERCLARFRHVWRLLHRLHVK